MKGDVSKISSHDIQTL